MNTAERYQCKFCLMSFLCVKALSIHVKSRHLNTKFCEVCKEHLAEDEGNHNFCVRREFCDDDCVNCKAAFIPQNDLQERTSLFDLPSCSDVPDSVIIPGSSHKDVAENTTIKEEPLDFNDKIVTVESFETCWIKSEPMDEYEIQEDCFGETEDKSDCVEVTVNLEDSIGESVVVTNINRSKYKLSESHDFNEILGKIITSSENATTVVEDFNRPGHSNKVKVANDSKIGLNPCKKVVKIKPELVPHGIIKPCIPEKMTSEFKETKVLKYFASSAQDIKKITAMHPNANLKVQIGKDSKKQYRVKKNTVSSISSTLKANKEREKILHEITHLAINQIHTYKPKKEHKTFYVHCINCKQDFPYVLYFAEHFIPCQKEKVLSCSFCKNEDDTLKYKSLPSKAMCTLKHIRDHVSKFFTSQMCSCGQCKQQFITDHNVLMHYTNMHLHIVTRMKMS